MKAYDYFIVYFLIFLFGTVIGSFLNVVILRLPAGNLLSEKRSRCPSCGEQLKAYDLIPILSFILLKGRCRSCKQRISIQYPLIELFCGLISVGAVVRFGPSYEALYVFAICVILTAVAMIDFSTLEIPNGLVIALAVPALAGLLIQGEPHWMSRIIGFFVISVPMLILALVIKGAFGGGDIKLVAVCGFILGLQNVVVAMFIALLLGGGYAVYLLVTKKSQRGVHIAFAPYICVGTAVALFAGNEIAGWYLSFFITNTQIYIN